jgi:hypothetical protein
MQMRLKMLKKIAFLALILSSNVLAEDLDSYRPMEGYVASEQTAKTIAEAVLIPIYGKENIDKQKPFKIQLKDNTWIVNGTLPSVRGRVTLGGTFTIHISKLTGEILFLMHEK